MCCYELFVGGFCSVFSLVQLQNALITIGSNELVYMSLQVSEVHLWIRVAMVTLWRNTLEADRCTAASHIRGERGNEGVKGR